MTTGRPQLTWARFDETMLAPRVPAQHAVSENAYFFVDRDARRMGLRYRAPEDAELPTSTLASIGTFVRDIGGSKWFEISTSAALLFREFYSFLIDVVDRVQAKGQPLSSAFSDALEGWNELLKGVETFTLEQQLGLIGELWVLERLAPRGGIGSALDAWVGPLREPHDFRLSSNELEVKSTLGLDRVHMINGLTQLVPTSGNSLHVLSLQYERSGAATGKSLSDTVRSARQVFAGAMMRFDELLATTGYRDEDAPLYTARVRFRSRPRLVRVDDSCPRLTHELLASRLAALLPRISDVHYRIDLTGLGVEEGTEAFAAILPG